MNGRDYVVIGLTEGDCPQAKGRDCVSWVHGPFPDHDTAKDYAAAMPEGFNAHILSVGTPFTTSSAAAKKGQADE